MKKEAKEVKPAAVAKEAKPVIVSKAKLLEAGAYFGHKTHAWNPKMKEFIVPGRKNKGSHVIDIIKTQKALELAYNMLNTLAAKGAQFIFVGTKKQAREAVREAAERTNSLFVTERWLGGTLTNNSTIMSRVKKMKELEDKAATGFAGYTKKEALLLQKDLDKLHKNLNGIRTMGSKMPQIMIVADPNEDAIAVKEARRKKIKVVGIMDTNTDPDLLDFGIPANDDSAKSITLIMTILADAIVKARGGQHKFAFQEDEKVVLPSFQKEQPQVQVESTTTSEAN
ncbi:30S ribosomal protein S2 [Mycoplasma nasistruthionis]|uniref:30S ribosomal protein S2 n=1 Tax=Mycoplasma nasistruthionis TaxID=353852 RepID=UPI001FEA53DD|nr:30S ribosomal protein S2 [Mycoplasma nasistruthionis]